MTENADVGWLRETFGGYIPPEFNAFATREVYFMQMRRILAHIDQLERDIEDFKKDALRRALCNEPEPDSRPTIHEIAAQMMASIMSDPESYQGDYRIFASQAYDAAEALVAKGRRWDGQGS